MVTILKQELKTLQRKKRLCNWCDNRATREIITTFNETEVTWKENACERHAKKYCDDYETKRR